MGNCIVLQEKVVKVMKPDGKIVEYKAPIGVQNILSRFSGYALSDSRQDFQNLLPDDILLGGNLYNLVALPSSSASPQVRKKVSFSIPEEENKQVSEVVRIKVILSKQQLHEILQKGVSVDKLVSQLQDQQKAGRIDKSDEDDNHKAWKPVLESIPEID